MMRNASLQHQHFAPRIVGKGGILEAFGVGAVCCNWASLLDGRMDEVRKAALFPKSPIFENFDLLRFLLKLWPQILDGEALVPFLPLLVCQPSPPTAKSLEGVPTTCVLACV